MTEVSDAYSPRQEGTPDTDVGSEERLFFNQIAFGMAKASLQGRHLLVNDRYCEITGYTREELLAKSFLDITHPDDIDRNRVSYEKLLRRQIDEYQIEKRYVCKHGQVVWVQVSVSLEVDADGNPRALIAGIQDISGAKQKERALRFLVDVNNACQQLVDPEEIMVVVARMLGEHLGVDRCAYAETEADEDHFTITGDYTRNVPSIVGRFSMSQFGSEVLRLMRANLPYVIDDVDNDSRAGADLSAYRQTQIQAVVCVPLHKAGRFVAAMAVHQKAARHWHEAEVELVQLVVGRCWESIERTRTLRSLRESERQVRFVMDSMPQKVFTADPQGETTYYNSAWGVFTGNAPERLLHSGWMQMVHPDDLESNIEAWQDAVTNRTEFHFEHRFEDRHGDYRWHLSRASPLQNLAGDVVMWVGSSTDIHDLKAAELELTKNLASERYQAALLARLAGASQAIHAVLSVEGIAHTLTEEVREIIGVHQAAVSLTLDVHWTQAVTAVSRSDEFTSRQDFPVPMDGVESFAEVCRSGRAMRLTREELEQQSVWQKPGPRAEYGPPLNGWLAVPLIGHGGRNLGLIQASDKLSGEFTGEDEAILRQLAVIAAVGIENALLYDSLREQDRRKDEFLATLAHELRNPLAPLRTGLDLLGRLSEDGQTAHPVYRIMQRQLGHLVRLVDDLLDVSRVSRGKVELKRETIPLRGIMESAVEASSPMIDAAHQRLTVTFPSAPVALAGDPTRLAQVIINLLNNAAKFTPEGGAIELRGWSEPGQAVIQVRDNGIGIGADMLVRIFDLFTQVDPGIDRSRGGLGIGLSLVKKLVELHDGSVTATSAGPGKGSCFTVRLPRLDGTEESDEGEKLFTDTDADTDTDSTGQTSDSVCRRVLVVDDNVEAAQTLGTLLGLMGHETRLAYHGAEALTIASRWVPELIFLDIGLPGMSGYEVAATLRADASLAGTTLVALTGWGSEEDRRRSSQAGFHHHLTKPIGIDDLDGLFQTLTDNKHST